MARYFARFQPLPNSQYTRLFRELHTRSGTRFCIATLNYENLIEHSLAELGVRNSVIKPHGSCGFLPTLPPGLVIENSAVIGSVVDVEGLPTTVEINPDRIEQWCIDRHHDWLAPVMSFYAPDKPTKVNRECIALHRAIWAQRVAECDVCFVVGGACNPADSHVWGPLASGQTLLIYVNPHDDGFAAWVRDTGRIATDHWPFTFEAAIPRIADETNRPWPI